MNSLKTSIILSLVLLHFGTGIIAQSQDSSEHLIHEPHHKHPNNEIGLANHMVYLGNEREFSYGIHVHYLRAFDDSKFGAGFGYEQIFDEHKHRTIGIIGTYRLIEPVILSLSPGILFTGNENQVLRFALHAEAVYEFEIGNFHLGPAMGFALTSEEYHVSIGLHLAYAF